MADVPVERFFGGPIGKNQEPFEGHTEYRAKSLLRAIRDMGHMGSIPEEFKGDRHLERLFEKSIFANMAQESQREYISRTMGEIDRKSSDLQTEHSTFQFSYNKCDIILMAIVSDSEQWRLLHDDLGKKAQLFRYRP